MKVPSGRLTAFLTVVLAATALLFILSLGGQLRPSLASHAGGADFFLIDMDPTGNTATSIGTVEPCARVNPNGIQDADEETIDSVDIDIVTGPAGIPASNPAIALTTTLTYPAPWTEVIGRDPLFLLNSAPGSAITTPGDSLPDSDGAFLNDVVDLGAATAESGPGVLSRFTLRSTPGAPAGLYSLRLESAFHFDTLNNAQRPDNEIGFVNSFEVIPSATIAIDVPCPQPADLQGVSLAVTAPAGASAGETFNLDVTAVIANSGPLVADVEITFAPVLPPYCYTPDRFPRLTVASVPVSASVFVGPYQVPVTCFAVGPQTIDVQAGVSRPDSDPTNNLVPSAVSNLVTIGDAPPGEFNPQTDSARIYWANGEDDVIQRSDLSGGNIETVISPVDPAVNVGGPIVIDPLEGRVYWSGGGIRRSNIDGTGEQLILPGVSAFDLALDLLGRKLYWTTSSGLYRASLDGAAVELFEAGHAWGVDIDPVESMVYWTTIGPGSVFEAPLLRKSVAGGPTQLVAEQAGSSLVSIDALDRTVYLGLNSTSPGRIERMNLSGTDRQLILDNVRLRDVQAAGGAVYWVEHGGFLPDKIMTAGPDGSGITELVAILSSTTVGADQAILALAVLTGDEDGLPSVVDNCPNDPNPTQADFDQDGAGDVCDLCPDTPSGAAVDRLGCSLAQVDSDGDGVCNEDAPSMGPPPGCLRSVAVGGIAGLLDPDAAAPPPSPAPSVDPPLALISAAAAAALVAGSSLVLLWRRPNGSQS
jgi:hypothetical protein